MATIITRNGKGSPLTNTELDSNFTNINDDLATKVSSSGLGAGVSSFLTTPTSSNLAAAVSDETGSGSLVFSTSPTLTTPNLGTPSTLVGTNISGTAPSLTAGTVTTNANLTGPITSVGNATSIASQTGTGSTIVVQNSPSLTTPNLGTPSSATLTNATGLPISTGVSGLASGAATFLATPTSANLSALLIDETGTGANVFATNPVLVTPNLGTPSAVVLTNASGTAPSLTAGSVTTNANLTGPITSVGNATSVAAQTGTGSTFVMQGSPTLTTPNLGTPSAVVLTNATGLPVSTGISGLASGVAAFLASPSSANFAAVMTDETGTGANVFATSPTLVTPNLGTPSSVVLTNATGTASGLTSGITNALKSATTTVDVATSTAPTSGQVLTATSGTAATWQTPVTGSSTTLTVSNKTAAYTVVAGDNGAVIRTTSGSGSITLPSCATVGVGFNFYYSNNSTAPISINVVGSDTFSTTGTAYIVPDGTTVQYTVVDASATGKWNLMQISSVGNSDGSVVVGANSARALAFLSTAIGASAQVQSGADRGTAIGYASQVTSSRGTAMGANSTGGGATSSGSGAMALGGSYASGTDSFAAANGDNTGTYGAQGINSIAIGFQAKSVSSYAIAIGSQAPYANASGAVVLNSGRADGINSVVLGYGGYAVQYGKYVFSSGILSSSGSAQLGALVLRQQLTTATPTALTSNGSVAGITNQLILPNDSSYTFTGSVIARNTALDTDSKAFTFVGAIRRGTSAANTFLIGTPEINIVGSDGSAWTIALTADTTNGGLAVTVTGEASKTINWVCRIDTVEVTG